jgi:hypothetical protein
MGIRTLAARLLRSAIAVSALAATLTACSGVEIQTDSVDAFASHGYQYYKWRTAPLPATRHTSDPTYALDPVMRKEVNRILQEKGYLLDPERAQFSVDYLFATGLRDGASPEQASNISPIPSATMNRQVDQASVDNAIALGGVKETNNIVLQFNDSARKSVVWRAMLTNIVEDANRSEKQQDIDSKIQNNLARAMKDLPAAGSR